MHALVVYESMYDNTRTVAERICAGLRTRGDARVVPVGDAAEDEIAWADLVVVGGQRTPTL
jgi:menaquinone-dependent protoporphyrinogen IX oxidase